MIQIFVLGCPRSGVNLAANLIASHPGCYLLDNLDLATRLLQATPKDNVEIDLNLSTLIFHELNRVHNIQSGHSFANISDMEALVTPVILQDDKHRFVDMLQMSFKTIDLSRIRLIEISRDESHISESFARFPSLYEYLPSSTYEKDQFEESVRALFNQSLNLIENLRAQGWIIQIVYFQKMLIYGASYIWNIVELSGIGLRSLHSLKGITSSISFRSRNVDGSSFRDCASHLLDISTTAESHTQNISPVVGTGRGGSGTRMLTTLFMQLGIYMGGTTSHTGDSVSWADLIYEMALHRLSGRKQIPPKYWNARLHHRKGFVLDYKKDVLWGLKLPEIMLVMPEILTAWPKARLVHIVRHPVETCLRRPHMTSTTKSLIGRKTLNAAYTEKYGKDFAVSDKEYFNNALSWWYQLKQVNQIKEVFGRRINLLELRYEDICLDPQSCADQLAAFLGISSRKIKFEVDQTRRVAWDSTDSRSEEIWSLCKDVAEGYRYKYP